ncbi:MULTISPECIES: ABC transporter permease [Paenibacillus]|uniref:Binding-protein-dependent transport systems inner membrane component n=2 Tax=Paenibacillus lactis TaxID=228574 RepID=G4H8N8_9BACL|nr:binding-protein-dependent transport systems inner membrane component [Paenibacillus lactis 154]MBP1894175.1 putative aldouronate transport system permease protein [Paenibacillus lactis]GIO89471.1 sugar ABC transporter permease [Paenibacillus lactis]
MELGRKDAASARISQPFGVRVRKDFKRNRLIYLMLLPVVAFYAIFHYGPLYGLQIAFKNFSPGKGIWHSEWVGFQHFQDFFTGFFFERVLRNTVLLGLYDLIFVFPASILLALMLNEVRSRFFKRTVQSITYIPHFISVVVVVGMMVDFMSTDGLINQIIQFFGGKGVPFLRLPEWFRTLFTTSAIWQGVGWGSIIYLAAISNIDPSLYEAAKVDGAGRWKQMLRITLPGIMPTVIILFILRIGSFMVLQDEKILLMYNPSTYETADVIGTYVYRKGILEASYSYAAAVGMFNSLINMALLLGANYISKRYSDTKLW